MSGKPARSVTTNAKAKSAAAIAAAESKADEAATQPRKRGRPAKAKAQDPLAASKGLPDATSNMEQPELEAEGNGIGVDIDWNGDESLTWTMVNAIADDENTRRSLFPPPGSLQRNGGLPKKHYHFVLAETCFAEHPTYQAAFAKAEKPKQKKGWSDKIKNRIKIVTDKTRKQIEMMGQTGAGIDSAAEVLPGTVLKTKWDEIKEDSPWFWEVRSLIGERPNLRPVGIGNNGDEIDTSMLLSQDDDDASDHFRTSSPDIFPERLLDDTGMETDPTVSRGDPDYKADDSDASASDTHHSKRKKAPTPELLASRPAKKTKPKPAVSAPAPAKSAAKSAKPATVKDKFTAAVMAEEQTAQALLGLKKDKNKSRRAIELAKIDALTKVKVEKLKTKGQEKLARLEIARMKMEQDHQLRMAQLKPQAGPSSMGSASFFGNDMFSVGDQASTSSGSTPSGFEFDHNLQLPPF